MKNHNGFFVGFHSLEVWQRATATLRPVYAIPIEEPGPVGNHGLQVNDLVVMISQIEPEDAQVYYVRLKVGVLEYLNGSPWGDDNHAERKQRLNQVYELVTAWLAEHGYTVYEGAVAMPRDLKFLNGWADFLKYDMEKKVYYQQAEAA
jgi:hypothetical protein